MNVIDCPSPNFKDRDGQSIDMLVMHYTGMPTAQEALERLRDPNVKDESGKPSRVSAHYLVDEDGTIYRLVPEEKCAWHAGTSGWRGNININERSIGIEIVNPGHDHGYRPFPQAQMDAVAALSKNILARHPTIPSWNVVGHSDIAPERKDDPGELFDWKFLAEHNIGQMPSKNTSTLDCLTSWVTRIFSSAAPLHAGMESNDVRRVRCKLADFGYGIDNISKHFDQRMEKVVRAFQQHFRPEKVDGIWDKECDEALKSLLNLTPEVTLFSPDSRKAAGQGSEARNQKPGQGVA